jgi:hypothetical protein
MCVSGKLMVDGWCSYCRSKLPKEFSLKLLIRLVLISFGG